MTLRGVNRDLTGDCKDSIGSVNRTKEGIMSRYGFVVSASRPEVAKGKVVYSARMRHLDVIRGRRNGFGARRDRLSALWRDGGWNGFVRIALAGLSF